ncbi:type I restriction-modification system specificity [Oceanimonas sp. GK1]|uniref:restriction endonuclease subunit S n=1 Tax=Oceanimonas sp. (strain GK1 / IBRC-M 10197) TaxID=511062 RepID=UPI0002494E0E|nr:restriction endonuclease subunit S [Oceanimonas sp. GK1]AEY01190.1 type I restriction-modification system specificity [Oceanimonas sp. GK1]
MSRAQTLITENIATWTGAIQAKSTAGRGSSNKHELYGIKKLRELILELAVRGKLVPQDPNDEPASVLLERIAAEKAELIKQGKIKKSKALPSISDEEKPFELPEGWEWTHLQTITSYVQRGKGPNYSDSGQVRVISQKCVQWKGFDIEPARYISDSSLDKYQPERFLQEKDLLWNSTGTGTVGRINVLSNIKPNSLVADSHVTVIRPLLTSSLFLNTYISSHSVQKRIEPTDEKSLVSGSTKQVELSTSAVNSLVVPLPPLKEQQRIVEKVDELMALCDQLEQQTESSIEAHSTLVDTLLSTLPNSADADELQQNWGRIAGHFDTLFTTEQSIDALKQTILQLAVMGKLVRQNPNDEPAAVLLKRIAAEKDRLVKEKKIKKQKPLPEISEDEEPFELPEGWEWVKFGFIITSAETGLDRPKAEQSPDQKFAYFKMNNIGNNGGIEWKDITRVDASELEKEKYKLTKGDFLFNTRNSRELVGKTCVFNNSPEDDVIYNNNILRVRLSKISPYFIDFWFRSTSGKDLLESIKSSTTNVCAIYQGKLVHLICPIAPVLEQKSICQKVDELMALCDQLKHKLQQSQQTQVHLTDAIVEQALA